MKFSIVIPNFNKGQYIAETIDSVLAQDYDDLEVIIVDDRSTDNSWEVITRYADQYKKIKAYLPFEKNSGGSACRNYGWIKASGDLIMFLDSDDLLADYCLSSRLKFIQSDLNNDFWVFPTGTFYNAPGDSSSIWRPIGSSFLTRFLAHELPWNVMSVVWKAGILKELNGFDEDYPRLQDVELHTRALIAVENNFMVYPDLEVDCYYRIDMARSETPAIDRLSIQFTGVSLYVEKMMTHLKESRHLRALRGTIFSFVNRCNYESASGLINHQEYKAIYRGTINYMETSTLFGPKHVKYLGFYSKLYQQGLFKIKGFNYLSKKLFMLI